MPTTRTHTHVDTKPRKHPLPYQQQPHCTALGTARSSAVDNPSAQPICCRQTHMEVTHLSMQAPASASSHPVPNPLSRRTDKAALQAPSSTSQQHSNLLMQPFIQPPIKAATTQLANALQTTTETTPWYALIHLLLSKCGAIVTSSASKWSCMWPFLRTCLSEAARWRVEHPTPERLVGGCRILPGGMQICQPSLQVTLEGLHFP